MSDSEVKVTVEQFLEKGFEFVGGDTRESFFIEVARVTLTDREAKQHNNTKLSAETLRCYVNFPLTWRENTGLLPYNESLLIEVIDVTGEIWSLTVHEFNKAHLSLQERNIKSVITHWRPSIKNWEKEEEVKGINEILTIEAKLEPLKTYLYPTTAEGKRELAAQLMTEASVLEENQLMADLYDKLPDNWSDVTEEQRGFLKTLLG